MTDSLHRALPRFGFLPLLKDQYFVAFHMKRGSRRPQRKCVLEHYFVFWTALKISVLGLKYRLLNVYSATSTLYPKHASVD